jgi:hypothetical protein
MRGNDYALAVRFLAGRFDLRISEPTNRAFVTPKRDNFTLEEYLVRARGNGGPRSYRTFQISALRSI